MPACADPRPRRQLSTWDGAALVVSNVIGVGIFTTPGLIAGLLPDPLLCLGVWLAGGVLALCGALAYAELAARLPRAGGEYLYLRTAFGPLAGFLSGWTSFIAGFSGAVAAAAVGFAAYLERFLPQAASQAVLFAIPLGVVELTVTPRRLVALGVIAAISAVHARGLTPARGLQAVLTAGCLLAVAALIGGGMRAGGLEPARLQPLASAAGFSAVLLALVPVLFTYSGWNAAVYVAEEVRDPERSVRRALLLGTALVIATYLALNLLYLTALPLPQLAAVVAVGDAVAATLFGDAGAIVVTMAILLALLSSISAMVMAGPRVVFAMARDGLFPAAAGRLHRRQHTPAAAITAQGVWSALLVFSGTFEALLIYTGFSVVLFAGLAVLALLVLRHRNPDAAPRHGGRLPPFLFLGACVLIVGNAIYARPGPTGAGLAVIACGLPVFAWLRQRPRAGPRLPGDARGYRASRHGASTGV